MAYGSKLLFNWGAAVCNGNWPLFSNDPRDTRWMGDIPREMQELVQFMRPDCIDEFAPDARRELAKGVSLQVRDCRLVCH